MEKTCIVIYYVFVDRPHDFKQDYDSHKLFKSKKNK